MTTNTIECEKDYLMKVEFLLKVNGIKYIVSPVFIKEDTSMVKVIWFSQDCGALCREISDELGFKHTDYIDGVEVA